MFNGLDKILYKNKRDTKLGEKQTSTDHPHNSQVILQRAKRCSNKEVTYRMDHFILNWNFVHSCKGKKKKNPEKKSHTYFIEEYECS